MTPEDGGFLEGQRLYMPAKHRRFVEVFARGESIADLIRHRELGKGLYINDVC